MPRPFLTVRQVVMLSTIQIGYRSSYKKKFAVLCVLRTLHNMLASFVSAKKSRIMLTTARAISSFAIALASQYAANQPIAV